MKQKVWKWLALDFLIKYGETAVNES